MPDGLQYEGPIIDTFLHAPWIGEAGIIPRADVVPWTEMAVRLAARHAQFYICTSAWSPKSYPAALMQFMAGRWHGQRGSEKVLFASDYPLLDLGRTVAAARGLALPGEDLRRVLHDNAARRLFGQGGGGLVRPVVGATQP